MTHRPGSLCGKPDLLSRRTDYAVESGPENFIQLLQPCKLASLLTYSQLHRRFGHIGKGLLSKTLKATPEIKHQDMSTLHFCEPCELGKSIRSHIPAVGSGGHDVLEVIESDTQGPFPVRAFDGTNGNIKFIGAASGYLKMETISDHTAATMLGAFQRFKTRLEKQTGKHIKAISTDQGTEYQGVFQLYLEEQGIIKRKGFNYFHRCIRREKSRVKSGCKRT